MLLLRTALVSLLCLTPSLLSAQQYTPARITFANPGPYTQADLAATSGLLLGHAFDKQGLQAAAQKLMATGLFDDVQVVLDGPIKSITVKFTLKPYPKEQLLDIDFENLVWWQPGELMTELHKQIPLLATTNPTLSESGDEQDAVETALQSLLAAKGITARVSHRILEPSLVQPRRTVAYTLEAPPVILHSFVFTGVSASQAPAVKKLLPLLIGHPYVEGATPGSAITSVLNMYQDAGFLQVAFTDVHRALSVTPAGVAVDLSGNLQEGEIFHLAKLNWAGSPIFSSADFAKGAKLHPGDIASRRLLLQTLSSLDGAYRSKGYIDLTIDTAPALDTAAHTVSYTVTVSPGEQYRLHTITTANLDPAQTAEFNGAWKLNPGDVYNADYVATFLASHNLPTLAGISATATVTSDPTSHLVDLTITFPKR
jgi:outer membrane protein insertion porin family